MPGFVSRVSNEAGARLRGRLIALFALLAAANVAAWIWAYLALRGNAVLFGAAMLAYTFGLRHAVDADHIAAIDNSTRKLMQQGQRPIALGFFFSLGHSLVVLMLSVAVGFAASEVSARFDDLKAVGGVIGASVSALFLFLLAAFNILVLISVWRTFQAVRRGAAFSQSDFDLLLNNRGFLARLFRPLFGLVAQELASAARSASCSASASIRRPKWRCSASPRHRPPKALRSATLLVFPALFTAGMTLIDTTDGVLMLGAYGWAFMKPIRKLYYNITITAVSVVVAVLIGGVETLGLVGDTFKLEGAFWDAVGALNGNFGVLGYVIIGVFVASWLASVLIYRVRGYDALDVKTAA